MCKGYSRHSITFRASAATTAKLHLLDPEIYKLPYYCNDLVSDDDVPPINLPSNFIIPKLMLRINLEPAFGLDWETDSRPDFDETDPEGKVAKGLARVPEYKPACEKIQQESPRGEDEPHPVVLTTLGTVRAPCTKISGC